MSDAKKLLINLCGTLHGALAKARDAEARAVAVAERAALAAETAKKTREQLETAWAYAREIVVSMANHKQ